MAKKLAGHTIVNGVIYSPEDDLPADVAKEITNPAAWATDGGGDDAPVDFPEGEPTESWKSDELDAYAAAKGVDISGAKNKADKVAALAAAKA